ncbi:MAG: lamin tail domain-containing protein [Sedimentisphaerales bacterium]|nr:lamin tail domain-containing protein [Sedimentisphaerales bacterium]
MPFRILPLILAVTCAAAASGQAQAGANVLINEIHCNPDVESELVEFIELHNAGASDVDLSGWYFDEGVSYVFGPGARLPANGYIVIAEDPQQVYAKWGTGRFPLNPALILGPYAGRLSNEGEKLVLCDAGGEVVDEVEYKIGFPWPTVGDPVRADIAGTGASLQLANPQSDNAQGGNWRSDPPTPAAANRTVYTDNLPPGLDRVGHAPQRPHSGESVTITIEAADPDGVAGVSLEYQVVPAGQYVPSHLPVPVSALQADPNTEHSVNPQYSSLSNWTAVAMLDDGAGRDAHAADNVYTAVIPPQANRTLVRYRITATDALGADVTAPYPDDTAQNFALYVYDGVPDYEGFPAETLQRLPVYHLLTRAEDMHQTLGYNSSDQIAQFLGGASNPARFVYNWYGTLVYDGVVYDNIRYRLRGGNGRYLGGNSKRSMRFRFNRGHYFQARDMEGELYPAKWRTLTIAKGFDNRQTLTFSLNEHVNFWLFNKLGVPAPLSHYFHFRVVDGAAEAPDPWRGDFWGLWFAQETYDVRFLETHDLEKGNLYKLVNSTRDAKEQQRYQAPYAVTDGSDHDNIENRLTGYSTTDFIRNHVRLDKWYAYHSLCQAIRNYDFWPSANKNAAWYFEPVYTPANSYLGLMWTLPWDTDASWGPTWNNGHDVVYNSVFPAGGGGSDGAAHPELQPDYYNAVREIRDLLWQRDQIEPLVDEFAAPIADLAAADLRRWLNAPSDAGNYNGLGGAGKNGLAALVEDMKRFAFTGGSWPGGSVGAGGRAAFLDSLADDTDGHLIPAKPSIAYIGEPGFRMNALRFRVSPFADPQGAGTFAGLRWRIAEVSPGAAATPEPTGTVLVPAGAQWRSFKGTTAPSSPAEMWHEPAFDDGTWQSGATPIGYGEGFLETTLGDMRGGYTSIYLRKSFEVTNPEAFDTVTLEVMYDDGVVVWINDKPAVYDNVSSPDLSFDATAEEAIENTSFVGFTLPDPAEFLVRGTNVIAVHVLNASLNGSSDCFFDLRLTGRTEPEGTSGQAAQRKGKYEIEAVWQSPEITEYQSEAIIPASAIKPGRTYRVRCRMKDNTGRWSHWSDPVQFETAAPLSVGILSDLRITEVMYNPAPAAEQANVDNDEFEFIELKNIGDETLDLTYVSFADGVTFDFAGGAVTALGPGEFVLVVRNEQAFALRYGAALADRIAGQYDGRLANEGETVTLIDFWNGTVAEFEYNDGRGWPAPADGGGHSLVPLEAAILDEPQGSLQYGGNWRASGYVHGSPGRDDPQLEATVVLNEIAAATDSDATGGSNDWIELYNAASSPVTLDNWYLSDDIDELDKWAIPPTTIPAGQHVSFDEAHDFHVPHADGFGLSRTGEQVFLSHLPGAGEDRIVDGVRFKAQEPGISWGRYPDGGAYWLRMPPTRDAANAEGLLDVVIDEIMYHPAEPNEEYVELYNPTSEEILLESADGPWRLAGGVDYVFDAGLSLPAGGRLIVVGFDPHAEPSRLAAFVAAYQTGPLTPGADVAGPFSGNLSNSSERIALEKPLAPGSPGEPSAWAIIDEVGYGDTTPWPPEADGAGAALQRIDATGAHSGNDPANWQAAPPTPGH